MAYVTIEDRVDRLEALFGQFLTEMALLGHQAQERDKAAEERNRLAEERNAAAEERNRLAEERMARFEQEMLEFKDEMREFKEESRQARRAMNKQWGDLANKMGTIVEDILAPNLRRLAREHFRFGSIQAFMLRCTRCRTGSPEIEGEFDTLVVGEQAVILGEAKSTPSVAYADEFAAKVAEFFDYFPEYRGRQLIAVFGSWAIPDRIVECLTHHGIYAMRMGEDTMELANAAFLEAGCSLTPA
jgi:hypothetical protein